MVARRTCEVVSVSARPSLPALAGGRRACVLRQAKFRTEASRRWRRVAESWVVSAKQKDEETVEKMGLEYGLFKTLTDKSKSDGSKKASAKGLLAKYGPAYLLTSISFAIVSFALCYFLVSIGIDISALLGKIGLHPSSTSEKVGRFAIAYAAHKAASPIRFPPTVALTPVVAELMGRKGGQEEEGQGEDQANE